MRELNVRLIMCFALLFATTSGAGCASQTPAAGCAGQCASSPGQGPTNSTVNNNAELNGSSVSGAVASDPSDTALGSGSFDGADVIALVPTRQGISARVSRFVEFLKEHLHTKPPWR